MWGIALLIAPPLAYSQEAAPTLVFEMSQMEVGDWQANGSETTDWVKVGGAYGCSAWDTSPTDVTIGMNFEQSRTCSQDYQRQVITTEKNADTGDIRVSSIVDEFKTETVTESQMNVGVADPWVVIASNFTAWAETSPRVYTAWSPVADSQTADFSQGRSYTVDRERTEQRREEHRDTGEVRDLGDPILHEETATLGEQRDVVVTSSDWSTVGSIHSCTSWSPAISTQTTDFGQSRDCSQDSERTWTYVSEGTEIHSRVEGKTDPVNQTRTVDVARSSGGGTDGWSSWSTYSNDASCTGWSPSRSSYWEDQTITQTRTCTDYQKRYIYYVDGGQVIHSRRQNRTVSDGQSRRVSGTKPLTTCVYKSANTYVSVRTDNRGNKEGFYYWNGATMGVQMDDSKIFTEGVVSGSYRYTPGDQAAYQIYKTCKTRL